ncbi:MAG: hypothetical protein CW691_01740 [Candidatus Bathyarchaeum sp.]|nr:MAG: hypothetical protein CW691_01740 [Candidatus Bathyarchaeum sp.]
MQGVLLRVDNLFDTVLQTVADWNPKEKYSTEREYRDDLLDFLQKNLNSESNTFSSAIWGLEHSGYHCIKKEAGRSLADIGIDDEVGIELKRNLKRKGQINRLVGQVVDYLSGYSCVIIVLCGDAEQEAVSILKYNLKKILKSFSSPFDEQKFVTIVIKCKIQKTRKPKNVIAIQ